MVLSLARVLFGVMGPCAAMGAGAAHALHLAGSGSTHDIDTDLLHQRLAANLD